MKIIIKVFVVSLFIVQATLGVFAQQSTFSKVFYDPNGSVQAYSIVKTLDHHYMIAGEKGQKAFALKMDSAGNILWSKTFGNTNGAFYSLTMSHDSCSVFAGYLHNSLNSTTNIFCVKMNSNGDTLWTRLINMGSFAEGFSIKQTFDNGFILAGDSAGKKIIVVKLTANGSLTWGRIITGGYFENGAYGIDQTPDTGFIVTGYLRNYLPSEAAMFLMKLTPGGTVSWTKKLDNTGQSISAGFNVKVIPGGIISLLSSSDLGLVIIKTDFSGNILWSNFYSPMFYPGPGLIPVDEMIPRIHATSDNGFIVVFGDLHYDDGVIKTDADGRLQWEQSVSVGASDIVESHDGGYIVIGNGPLTGVIMSGTDNPQVGVIKTDSLGNNETCVQSVNFGPSDSCLINLQAASFISGSYGFITHVNAPVNVLTLSVDNGCVEMSGAVKEENKNERFMSVFPNPTNGVFNVILKGISRNDLKSIELYNTLGELVYKSFDPGIIQTSINIGAEINGVYYLKVKSYQNVFYQKIVLNH
jgi:hypothetical protein